MNFADSVKTCLLEKYVKFDGRATRSEFWWFYLATLIINWGSSFIFGMINVPLASMVVSLGLMLPLVAAGIRRMHDTGNSGWFILIPFYNLYLWAQPTVPGDNKYGPQPQA